MFGHDVERPRLSLAAEEPFRDRSEEFLAAIVESSCDAVIAEDLNGLVTGWNRAAERLYGWYAEEVLGHSSDVVVPDDRRDERAAIRAAIGRGEPMVPLETERLTKAGHRLWVLVQESPIVDRDGRLVGASTIALDIGEHHRTQEALAASEARYHALVDALTEFVLVTDRDGFARVEQPSWSAFTGQDLAASIGSGWREAVHPDDHASFDACWTSDVRSGTAFGIACRVQRVLGRVSAL